MTEGQKTAEAELIPLAEVAVELHTPVRVLKELARAGKFPELLKVTAKRYLMRRADLALWKSGQWTSAQLARAEVVAESVREHPRNRKNKG